MIPCRSGKVLSRRLSALKGRWKEPRDSYWRNVYGHFLPLKVYFHSLGSLHRTFKNNRVISGLSISSIILVQDGAICCRTPIESFKTAIKDFRERGCQSNEIYCMCWHDGRVRHNDMTRLPLAVEIGTKIFWLSQTLYTHQNYIHGINKCSFQLDRAETIGHERLALISSSTQGMTLSSLSRSFSGWTLFLLTINVFTHAASRSIPANLIL